MSHFEVWNVLNLIVLINPPLARVDQNVSYWGNTLKLLVQIDKENDNRATLQSTW